MTYVNGRLKEKFHLIFLKVLNDWETRYITCHSINKYPFLFSFSARRELGTWYIHTTAMIAFESLLH